MQSEIPPALELPVPNSAYEDGPPSPKDRERFGQANNGRAKKQKCSPIAELRLEATKGGVVVSQVRQTLS